MEQRSNLCRHFRDCGGCAFQDLLASDVHASQRARVIAALAAQGLRDVDVADVRAVPSRTRRRASLKAQRNGDSVAIGFHAAASHRIVDMRECLVLTQRLFGALPRLRDALRDILVDGEEVELRLTEVANGIDAAFRWQREPAAPLRAQLARWADRIGLIRVTAGNDILVQLEEPLVRLGGVAVRVPPAAFLQPSAEGEAILVSLASAAVEGAKEIADLFAGCGTFALPLAQRARVHAVEFDRAMADALSSAARGATGLKPLTVERRDLFKRPLTAPELERFDAVLLDPPRAGAFAQVKAVAASRLKRLAYVSCDAETFARDARVLVEGGYRIGAVVPVDQFLWSEHIELVAPFERRRG